MYPKHTCKTDSPLPIFKKLFLTFVLNLSKKIDEKFPFLFPRGKMNCKNTSYLQHSKQGQNGLSMDRNLRACLKRRHVYVAMWPKLILADVSTNVYDGGCSRKVKTLK